MDLLASWLTELDWTLIGSFLRNLVLCACAIATVVVAFSGLSTWRKQLTGTAEFELARGYLKHLYAVRDALNDVRHPEVDIAEVLRAREKHSESGQEQPHAPYDRWKLGVTGAYEARRGRVRERLLEFDVEVAEAEVLWGNKVRDAVKPLREIAMILDAHVCLFLRYLDGDDSIESDEMFRIVGGLGVADDQFGDRLRAAVQSAEDIVRPRLER